MRKYAVGLLAAGFFCAPLFHFPQPVLGEEQKAPAEQLQKFEPFIGTWIFQGPTQEEAVSIPKGTRITVLCIYRWVLQGNANTNF